MENADTNLDLIYAMDHRGHLRGAVRACKNTMELLTYPDSGVIVWPWDGEEAAYRVTSVRRAGAEIHFEGRRLAA